MSLARRAAFRAFALGARPFVRRTPDAKHLNPKKILIIQLQQLGDSVVFTPTLRALRERFPRAEIAMLVNPVSHQLYRKSPHVDRFFVADSWLPGPGGTRLGPILPLLREIRREHFDLAIACVTQQAFKYGLIARLSGAPVRVGFDEGGRGVLYTVRVPIRTDASWLENDLDVARALGAESPSSQEEISCDAEDDARVDELFAELGIHPHSPIVVMHPGSNWQSKEWFPERWAAVADALVNRWDAQVVFVGITRERPIVADTRARMRSISHDLVGHTNLTQLAALLRRARLFIGTDSGPRNMAGAAGIPHIVLMSAQDDTNHWIGFRPAERILRELPPCHGCASPTSLRDQLCMRMIEVSQVLSLCEEILGTPRAADALSTNVA